MRVGFLGLGMMGTPMALNLCRQFPVVVWNRNDAKCTPLIEAGAKAAKTPSEVVERSDVIFIMLFDHLAIESMIDNETNPNFMKAIRGKTIINTSSVPVEFSHKLAQQVQNAGGKFIEMPVSGSKVPAEQGQLVGMMAGDSEIAEQIRPIVKPITTAAIYCGPIGSGLKAKYAINLFLVSVTAGLAESVNLARAQGIDLEAFGQVVNSCPLASAYSKVKIAKILKGDWTPQAAIKDCYNSTQLIKSAAQGVQVQTPLVQVCNSLYREAHENGWGEEDMMAIYKLFAESPSKYAT
jgi:3-hydroxyisobutyrate dehydrogenase-like beta-hydroxyacid dehydrogenase